MSSPFPAGGPSKISVSTTSASSLSTMRCAVVDPTKPPPTTVTFFLLMPLLVSSKSFSASLQCALRYLYHSLLLRLSRRCHTLHIFYNRRRKRRSSQLGRAGHQSLEVIRHPF